MLKKITSVALISSSFLFFGCTKDADPQPALIQNIELTTNSLGWQTKTPYLTATQSFRTEQITQNVIDKGLVQVFISQDNNYLALPFSYSEIQFTYGYTLYEVSIVVTVPSGGSFENKTNIIPNYKYKIAIISKK